MVHYRQNYLSFELMTSDCDQCGAVVAQRDIGSAHSMEGCKNYDRDTLQYTGNVPTERVIEHLWRNRITPCRLGGSSLAGHKTIKICLHIRCISPITKFSGFYLWFNASTQMNL